MRLFHKTEMYLVARDALHIWKKFNEQQGSESPSRKLSGHPGKYPPRHRRNFDRGDLLLTLLSRLKRRRDKSERALGVGVLSRGQRLMRNCRAFTRATWRNRTCDREADFAATPPRRILRSIDNRGGVYGAHIARHIMFLFPPAEGQEPGAISVAEFLRFPSCHRRSVWPRRTRAI